VVLVVEVLPEAAKTLCLALVIRVPMDLVVEVVAETAAAQVA
jgi:hypothetical protein